MFFEFMIACLATWRLSRFIRKEEGPARLMSKSKNWACRTFKRKDGTVEGTFAELIDCNKCLSFWLAIATSYFWWRLDGDELSLGIWLMMPWSISAVVIGIDYADGIFGIKHKLGNAEEKKFDSQGSCSAKEKK